MRITIGQALALVLGAALAWAAQDYYRVRQWAYNGEAAFEYLKAAQANQPQPVATPRPEPRPTAGK